MNTDVLPASIASLTVASKIEVISIVTEYIGSNFLHVVPFFGVLTKTQEIGVVSVIAGITVLAINATLQKIRSQVPTVR